MTTDNRKIKIESMCGIKHGAQVKLTWGKESGLLSTNEARQHAMRMMEAADGAESDEFLFRFMRDTVGLDDVAAVRVLADFRRFRMSKAESTDDFLLDNEMTTGLLAIRCEVCGKQYFAGEILTSASDPTLKLVHCPHCKAEHIFKEGS